MYHNRSSSDNSSDGEPELSWRRSSKSKRSHPSSRHSTRHNMTDHQSGSGMSAFGTNCQNGDTVHPPTAKRRRKNNIWGKVIQENILDQHMNTMMMKDIVKDRDVESYLVLEPTSDAAEVGSEASTPSDGLPFQHLPRDPGCLSTDSRKRPHPLDLLDPSYPANYFNSAASMVPSAAREPAIERLGTREWDRSKSRDHVLVNEESEPTEVSAEVARLLGEPKKDLIEHCVSMLGIRRTLDFYFLTEDVEAIGGLLTVDGSRRRTPGGVFLSLIRTSTVVPREAKKRIFMDEEEKKKKRKKIRRDRQENKIGNEVDEMEKLLQQRKAILLAAAELDDESDSNLSITDTTTEVEDVDPAPPLIGPVMDLRFSLERKSANQKASNCEYSNDIEMTSNTETSEPPRASGVFKHSQSLIGPVFIDDSRYSIEKNKIKNKKSKRTAVNNPEKLGDLEDGEIG